MYRRSFKNHFYKFYLDRLWKNFAADLSLSFSFSLIYSTIYTLFQGGFCAPFLLLTVSIKVTEADWGVSFDPPLICLLRALILTEEKLAMCTEDLTGRDIVKGSRYVSVCARIYT